MDLNERQSALSILMKSYFREREQLETLLKQLNKTIESNQHHCEHIFEYTGRNHNDRIEECKICGKVRHV